MQKLFFKIIAALCMVFMLTAFSACQTSDTKMKAPPEAGTSTLTPDKNDATPSSLSLRETVFVYLAKLKALPEYEIRSVGKTEAKKAFFTYTQTLADRTVKKDGAYFKEATSSSLLVNVAHACLTKMGGDVIYRQEEDGALTLATRKDYESIYGTPPDHDGLMGYIINEDTLTDITLTAHAKGAYTYHLVLHPEKAVAHAARQMKSFGGLDDDPTFSALTLDLTIREDWTPVSMTLHCTYEATLGIVGNVTCTQELTSVFYPLTDDTDLSSFYEFYSAFPTQSST